MIYSIVYGNIKHNKYILLLVGFLDFVSSLIDEHRRSKQYKEITVLYVLTSLFVLFVGQKLIDTLEYIKEQTVELLKFKQNFE